MVAVIEEGRLFYTKEVRYLPCLRNLCLVERLSFKAFSNQIVRVAFVPSNPPTYPRYLARLVVVRFRLLALRFVG